MTEHKPQNQSLRRKQASRIAAIQALYADHFNPKEQSVEAWVDQLLKEHATANEAGDKEISLKEQPERSLLITLLESAAQHEATITELIETHMGEGWKAERMGALLTAIVRIGIAELIAKKDRNISVIISEYVILTEAYCDDTDVAFVNGILAKIAEKIRQATGARADV